MDWDLIVACNNDDVLKTSLLSSPDHVLAKDLIVQKGFYSASSAYNDAIQKTSSEIIVFAHQDVYLPPGWCNALEDALCRLEQQDPKWAVAGVFGVDADGSGKGCVYSTGLQRVVGQPLEFPVAVRSLDEMVLIVRRSAGLRFDDQLPGFHLYGTDICLEASRRGYRSYAVPCFCIHNSVGIHILPSSYWICYLYMRRKWWADLPVVTPCLPITRWGGVALRYLIGTMLLLVLRRVKIGQRVKDPAQLSMNLIDPNKEKNSNVICSPVSPLR
ncbi:MAG: glycosyltransferase [Syntrophobacteraceae bacterium]|jgi:GT2 family glycosyltransferase